MKINITFLPQGKYDMKVYALRVSMCLIEIAVTNSILITIMLFFVVVFFLYWIAPTITLQPEVAAISPGQDEIVLQCLTNSNRFSVAWTSGSSSTVLSSDSTYRESVPPQSREYTCSVRIPDNNVVLASATVVVRDVQSKFCLVFFSCV